MNDQVIQVKTPRAGGLSAMTLGELQSYLGKAADLLRGSIDQADFKAFIFPLMFFKRISDVYLEEFKIALSESGGDQEFASFAENHRFQIPEGCLWGDVRSKTENVGQSLVFAFREIEKANPDTLYGIFGNSPWTNKQKIPDSVLIELVEHFSSKQLSNSAVKPDVFGDAYEYLIKRFADLSNKKAGEYYTPRSVVKLMVDVLDPKEGETVYDPACGTGGMLIEVIEHVNRAGGNPQLLWGKLFGQEKVLTTSGIARMNLLLHGIEDFKIVKEDTLRNPAFFDGDKLAQFDCVIANPPFSLENWGEETWISDRYGRNDLGGVPPKKNADWAWVQHMYKSMKSKSGRIAVVLPQGALTRVGSEGRIRQAFLEKDLIESVIGMAPNLFYGTSLAPCILILKANKHASLKDRILFINAESKLKHGRTQNTLEPDHMKAIFDAYLGKVSVPGLAELVHKDEITRNNWNLNITLYVDVLADMGTPTLEEGIASFDDAKQRYVDSKLSLVHELENWNLDA
jgi:type I restriction-modification system DNA methylase subunit